MLAKVRKNLLSEMWMSSCEQFSLYVSYKFEIIKSTKKLHIDNYAKRLQSKNFFII